MLKLALMLTLLPPAGSPPGASEATPTFGIFAVVSTYLPDTKVIGYSIESQSGKASDTITVVVQYDGSQGDSCGEYVCMGNGICMRT